MVSLCVSFRAPLHGEFELSHYGFDDGDDEDIYTATEEEAVPVTPLQGLPATVLSTTISPIFLTLRAAVHWPARSAMSRCYQSVAA
jgi:hypothetical protein